MKTFEEWKAREAKNTWNGFIRRPGTAEERTQEQKNKSVEVTQTENKEIKM